MIKLFLHYALNSYIVNTEQLRMCHSPHCLKVQTGYLTYSTLCMHVYVSQSHLNQSCHIYLPNRVSGCGVAFLSTGKITILSHKHTQLYISQPEKTAVISQVECERLRYDLWRQTERFLHISGTFWTYLKIWPTNKKGITFHSLIS